MEEQKTNLPPGIVEGFSSSVLQKQEFRAVLASDLALWLYLGDRQPFRMDVLTVKDLMDFLDQQLKKRAPQGAADGA